MKNVQIKKSLFVVLLTLAIASLLVQPNTKSIAELKTNVGITSGPPVNNITQTDEVMSVSAPIAMSPEQLPKGPRSQTLRYGEEEGAILSDIEPERLQELKNQSSSAQLLAPKSTTPEAYRTQIDSSTSPIDKFVLQPLAPNSFTSFEGPDNLSQLDGLLHRPPDGGMAAGPNHVVVSVNSLMTTYSKTGTQLFSTSLADWFSNVCLGCSPFDPRVIYDSGAGRWILIAVNGNKDTPNVSNYLLSVSQTSDPTGSWWLYSLNGILNYAPTGENTWADFPHLGFDGIASASGGAIYVTSNQFTFGSTPSFRTTLLNILPKSSLYSGAGFTYWRASGRANSDGSQAFTISPALTYGNPGGEFLVNSKNNGSFVSLWKVVPTYPPTAVNWTLQSTNNVGAYTIPPDAQQPGGCSLMATNDSRISSNSVWRSNKIYAALAEGYDWGGGGGTVAAIRFIQINTSTNATDQNVTYGADGLHYFFPTVAADGSDNVVLAFARAGSLEFGSIRYTGRLATEPPNTLQGSAQLKAGAECITGGRWGDYFAAALDPADTSKVWIFGEWAKNLTGVTSDWDWGTWIGQVGFSTLIRTLTVASSTPNSGVAITVSPNDNGGLGNGTTQFNRTYNNNTNVTLTAPSTASVNTFEKWQRDGVDWTTSQSTSVLMDANHTMTAVYKPSTYTITVSPSPSGSGTVSGGGTFAAGSSRTVTATANSGYTFANWTENGSVVSSSASYTFTLNSNRILVANFTRVYSITLSVSPIGAGTVSGGGTFAAGSSRTVTATANSGYTFANWTENGSVVSSSASYTFTLNSNRTLVANFTRVYSITLSVSPIGAGTVSGGGTFAAGSSRTVTATANSGYTFANWTESNVVVSSSASYTFTLNSNRNLVANFNRVTISVTVQTNPSGRSFTVDGVAYTAARSFVWVAGSSHSISTTSPQSGATGTRYVWSSWSDGGAITHTVAPSSNITYTANFTTQYFLTMNAGVGGTVSPTSNWYNSGASASISASPLTGYAFSSWSGVGSGSFSGTTNPATVTMNGPITETANFVAITNFARASNGGIATASSTLDAGRSPSSANNGDRNGIHWGTDPSTGSGWHDATSSAYPDWLQIDFNGLKGINEIDVFTVQDNYVNPISPTTSTTFSLYGITGFDVQYWNGVSWVTVPSGTVTGNNKVWRRFTFATPIQTSKIRVLISAALAGYSRITEVEAWGTFSATNVALTSNGGIASASSTLDSGRQPLAAINGDRKGLHWGTGPTTGSGWHDATSNSYPDFLQIDFNGSKKIGEIDVFTIQDNYLNPSEPTDTMVFTLYGITAFDVQYWNGSAWVTVPGGSVSGNNRVKRRFTFSPVTTSRIRVLVNGALASYSRIVEVEAYQVP